MTKISSRSSKASKRPTITGGVRFSKKEEKEFADYEKNGQYFRDHFDEITATPKYRGRNVVVVNQAIVGYGKSLRRLRTRLIARGVNMKSAYVEFVNFKSGTQILGKVA